MCKNYIAIAVFLFIIVLTSGCLDIKTSDIPESNIKISSWDSNTGFNLVMGAYSDVTYTLTNSGETGGYSEVLIATDTGKNVYQKTLYVPPQSSITNNKRVDTSIGTKSLEIEARDESVKLSYQISNTGFDINRGFYSDIKYTLTNHGNQNRNVETIIQTNDKGTVYRSYHLVPSRSTITNTAKVGVSYNTEIIDAELNYIN